MAELLVVATPIGNLADFSPRAREALERADLICAEDTRVTLKLLNHFSLKKPLLSYHRHNEEARAEPVIARMLGEDLTGSLHKMLAENGIKVVKGVKTISISCATKEESSLLGMGEGTALLLQRDISYDENGQAVYRSKSVINADRYTCTITMQA